MSMSILIKGMEMPKDCVFCPMAHWNKIDRLTGCEVVGGKRYVHETDTDYWESSHRPDWCPLVEVPKHGRLIDADELKIRVKLMNWCMKHYPDKFMDEVVHAPTIIEAEGET